MHPKAKLSDLPIEEFEGIFVLSEILGKPVTVFDLETTTFLEKPGFGITELGMLVFKDWRVFEVSSLVNPENRINPFAAKKTGIKQKMVDGEPNWRDSGLAELFGWAMGKHVVAGFNNKSFDCPGVIDQNRRYGVGPLEFESVLDVRDIHRKQTGSQKGRLEEVLAGLDRPFPGEGGQWHRAGKDALATALVLDEFCRKLGPAEVARFVAPFGKPKARDAMAAETSPPKRAKPSAPDVGTAGAGPTPKPKAPKAESPPQGPSPAERLLTVLGTREEAIGDNALIDEALGRSPSDPRDSAWYTYSLALSKLVDAPDFPYQRIADPGAQDWLFTNRHLRAAIEDSDFQTHKRLKPLLDCLKSYGAPETVSYVQLKIGLRDLDAMDEDLDAAYEPAMMWG